MPAALIGPPYFCSKCDVELTDVNSITNSKAKNKLYSQCRSCKCTARRQAYADGRGLEGMRARHLWNTYNLTVEQFDAMFYAQSGRCACCQEPFSRHRDMHIDHCHDSLVVRAILCPDCNVMEGLVRKKPQRLEMMAVYIAAYCK